MAGTYYSMGFAVSLDGHRVLLLEKNRPSFLAGQWMGVAGHIEPGETPLEAVRREAEEESGLRVNDWIELGMVRGQVNPDDQIFMFAARTDLSVARTLTDERVAVFAWDEVEALPLGLAVQEIMDRLRAFAAESSTPRPRGLRS